MRAVSSLFSYGLLALVAPFALGQTDNGTVISTNITCFQPIPTGLNSPNATVLSDFIRPVLNDACQSFANSSASASPPMYNATGYRIIQTNINEVPTDTAQCFEVLSSIVNKCLPSGDFGGMWSPDYMLSYMVTNFVFPDNPLVSSEPPTVTATTAAASSTTSATTTAPPVVVPPPVGGGGSGGDGGAVAAAVEEAIALSGLLLAMSSFALLAKPEASLALDSIRSATSVAQQVISRIPESAATDTLSGTLIVLEIVGVASEIFPDPVLALAQLGLLAAALDAAVEVDTEDQENATRTTSAASTTTTSSETNTPTQVVLNNQRWSGQIMDALREAVDGGEGTVVNFDALKIDAYITSGISEFVADVLDTLPFIDAILPNESPVEESYEASEALRWKSHINSVSESQQNTNPDAEYLLNTTISQLGKRTGSQLPQSIITGITFDVNKFSVPHLDRLSANPNGLVQNYVKSQGNGQSITLYIMDSGLGTTSPSDYTAGGEFTSSQVPTTITPTPDVNYIYYNCTPRFEQAAPLDQLPSPLWSDEDGHGTCVASVAAGKRYGAARNAKIVPAVLRYKDCVPTLMGTMDIWNQVVADIQWNDLEKKSIIVFSNSYRSPPADWVQAMDTIMKTVIANEVIVVAASGQRQLGDTTQDITQYWPQKLGDVNDDDVPVINIGGLLAACTPDPSAYQSPNTATMISAYASWNVLCIKKNQDSKFLPSSEIGTSFAAPAAAGVIADWISNQDIVDYIEATYASAPNWAAQVRRFLRDVSLDSLGNGFNAVYNGYNPDCNTPIAAGAAKLKPRQDTTSDDSVVVVVSGTIVNTDYLTASVCTLPSTSATTTETTTSETPTTSETITSVTTTPETTASESTSVSSTFTTISLTTTSETTSTSSTVTTSSSLVPACPSAAPSCDLATCAGTFDINTGKSTCKTATLAGCPCAATATTCGAQGSCDSNNCAGAFNITDGKAYCTNFFAGCECDATANTCGAQGSCDSDNCAGAFNTNDGKAYCTNFFAGCECDATANTCGAQASCDSDNCAGAFNTNDGKAYCTNFFAGCECAATATTCGAQASCDSDNCAGAFNMNDGKAYCTNFFAGCECDATANTCGAQGSCDGNNCAGAFNLDNGLAYCTDFFAGCQCDATANTCGAPASCDGDSCNGAFNMDNGIAYCTDFFAGCQCNPTTNTCGAWASCDDNDCNGAFNMDDGNAYCTGHFAGCRCTPTANTCGTPLSCQLNGCAGSVDDHASQSATCKGEFAGCQCIASAYTEGYCVSLDSCSFGDCAGVLRSGSNNWGLCSAGRYLGCGCYDPTSSGSAPSGGSPSLPEDLPCSAIPGCEGAPPAQEVTCKIAECVYLDENNQGIDCNCVCTDGTAHEQIGYGAPGETCDAPIASGPDEITLDILCALFPFLGWLEGWC